MAFCSTCGAQIPDGSTTCPACASRVSGGPAVAAAVPAAGLTDNIAGMLGYVTFIPAIIFLVLAPYNRNRFIRFDSFQCLFFMVALIDLLIALSIVVVVLFL